MVDPLHNRSQGRNAFWSRDHKYLQPIVTVRLFGTIIVRVGLRAVRFVVKRCLRVVPRGTGKSGFASCVRRGSALEVVKPVCDRSLQRHPVVLFRRLGGNPDSPGRYLHHYAHRRRPVERVRVVLLPVLFYFFSDRDRGGVSQTNEGTFHRLVFPTGRRYWVFNGYIYRQVRFYYVTKIRRRPAQ